MLSVYNQGLMLDKDLEEGASVRHRLRHDHDIDGHQKTGRMIIDSCRSVYVIVVDRFKALAPSLRRPAPAPVLNDTPLTA